MTSAGADLVPQDLPLLAAAGAEVRLGPRLPGTDTLVIFLRHLG